MGLSWNAVVEAVKLKSAVVKTLKEDMMRQLREW